MYRGAGKCDSLVYPVGSGSQWGHCSTGPDRFLWHGSDATRSCSRSCSERIWNHPGNSRHGHGFHPHEPGTFLHRAGVGPRGVSASADMVRVQLVTTMRMRYEGKWDTLGFDYLEIAGTSETPDMAFISWLAGREQASVEEAAHFLNQTEQVTQTRLIRLVEQGVLVETREHGQALYHLHFVARRRRQATSDIWRLLDEPGEVATHKREAAQRMNRGMRLK